MTNTYSRFVDFPPNILNEIDRLTSYIIPQGKWAFINHLKEHQEELLKLTTRLAAEARHDEEARKRFEYHNWQLIEVNKLIARAKTWKNDSKLLTQRLAATIFPDCWRCQWDHKFHFLHRGKKLFPTGLLFYVSHLLNGAEFVDQRRKPGERRPFQTTIQLRDYQEEIVQAAIEAERGVIEVATGGGKTEIAIELIARLGCRSLIIVPTTPIFNEFKSRWAKYCPDVPLGTIAKGKVDVQWVTLAIFDEGWARDPEVGGRLAREVDLILVDEHHKSAAKTWYDYIMSVDAYYRYGQTATARREEGWGETLKLHALTGGVIARKKTRELQDEGYLAEAKVEFIPVRCLPVAGSWADKYRHGIVHNAERNHLIVAEALAHQALGRRVLIIVAWEEHAELLMDMIGRENCLYLHGGMSEKKVAEIKQEFVETNKILIGTPVVDLGFDVPTIDVLIMAAGGKARGRQQQRLGRSLRRAPGKEFAQVIDFWDDDDDVLEDHSEERWRTYERLGQEVFLRE